MGSALCKGDDGRKGKKEKDPKNRFFSAQPGKPFLVYQLGTNNWQREGEFAPGSGILHEAHHSSYNNMDSLKCYSIYPSQNQSPHPDPCIEVYKLDHPIPICESVSPVSNYRWHSMSEEEFIAYRERLEEAVYKQMADAEEKEGTQFSVAIAHHSFLNPVILRNVLRRREKEGKKGTALVCFVHGTGLKMYVHEKKQEKPEEYPLRFFPFMEKEKVFDSWEGDGVQLCYAISNQQVDAFLKIFPSFPKDRIIVSPNGVNPKIFYPIEEIKNPSDLLSEYTTVPYEGSSREPVKIDGSKYKNLVVYVGKFAEWKRLEALLQAAESYEKKIPGTATVIIGHGPLKRQKAVQDFAYEELKLEHTYFIGPHPQPILAKFYSAANVGCFPSYQEPFGLVFIETMACGTPVIGANSGGPKDFVDSSVGELVPESDDIKELGNSISEAVQRAINEDWKSSRQEACLKLIEEKYSVKVQCTNLINTTCDFLKVKMKSS